MKLHRSMLMSLFLFAGALLFAQDLEFRAMVYVPFDFVVNGTTLAAGNYFVKADTSDHLMPILNADTGATAVAFTKNETLQGGRIHETSSLVFAEKNGLHILHQVRIRGDDRTYDLMHGANLPELLATR